MCVYVFLAEKRKELEEVAKFQNLPTTSPVNHHFPSYPPHILFRHVLLSFPAIIISVRLHFLNFTPSLSRLQFPSLYNASPGDRISFKLAHITTQLLKYNQHARYERKREENYHHRQISYCLRHKKHTNWDERVCMLNDDCLWFLNSEPVRVIKAGTKSREKIQQSSILSQKVKEK